MLKRIRSWPRAFANALAAPKRSINMDLTTTKWSSTRRWPITMTLWRWCSTRWYPAKMPLFLRFPKSTRWAIASCRAASTSTAPCSSTTTSSRRSTSWLSWRLCTTAPRLWASARARSTCRAFPWWQCSTRRSSRRCRRRPTCIRFRTRCTRSTPSANTALTARRTATSPSARP